MVLLLYCLHDSLLQLKTIKNGTELFAIESDNRLQKILSS